MHTTLIIFIAFFDDSFVELWPMQPQGSQASVFLSQSQAQINAEVCVRKGIQHKNLCQTNYAYHKTHETHNESIEARVNNDYHPQCWPTGC